MNIAIIGAGNMGGAVARGILKNASAHSVYISNPSTQKLEALKQDFPQVQTTTNNLEVVKEADLIILAVKPWLVAQVITEISGLLDAKKHILASLAGGISLNEIDGLLPNAVREASIPLCHLMPNTAIAHGSSMTFISTLRTTAEIDAMLLQIFSTMGKAMLIKEELMPAATSLASCGIAFALRYIRAAQEGGVELGFRPQEAQEIVCQTLKGAIDLLSQEGAHPEAEIDKVTTPGGLTIRGLNAMEACGFTHSVQQGLRASLKKGS
jgi:pyrroline-5-carboxylate reductase